MSGITEKKNLPLGAYGRRSSGWWGVWTLIFTEASLFGYLLLSYYYLWTQTTSTWPPDGLPDLKMSVLNTIILLSSSIFVWRAEASLRKGHRQISLTWLATALIAGIAFIGIQLSEWHKKPYELSTNLYSSLYFTITGFHLLHVAAGLITLGLLWLWTSLGYFSSRRTEALSIGGLYWHFVDVVWLFIFTTFFLTPYMK